MLFSPTVELAPAEQANPQEAQIVRDFAKAYLAGHPDDDPLVNPLLADFTDLPPMLIQAGTGDNAFEQARRLADHARGHGITADLDIYRVAAHIFHLFWPFLPEAATALEKAGEYIRAPR